VFGHGHCFAAITEVEDSANCKVGTTKSAVSEIFAVIGALGERGDGLDPDFRAQVVWTFRVKLDAVT